MIRLHSLVATACLAGTLWAGAPHSAFAQAAPPASSRTFTPTHLALARELATINGVSQIFENMAPQFAAQMRQITVTRPELAKDLDQVLEGMKPDVEARKQEMLNAVAQFYASALTEAELKDVVAFFKTPAGRKYVQITPQVMDQIADETERWVKRVQDYMLTRVRAEMSKRGHQL
jgi:hypothetical protein